MALIVVPNGQVAETISAGTVIVAEQSPVDLLAAALPAGSSINAVISRWPRGAVGIIQITGGAGASAFTLSLQASDLVGIPTPRPVQIPISGPGQYSWPTSRLSLATALYSIQGPSPGGALSVALLQTVGIQAGDGALSVLGIVAVGAAPGGPLQVITSGPASANCIGGWNTGDALCAAMGGVLRKIAPGETGLDQVAIAQANQNDGDLSCPVLVALQAR